MRTSLVCRQVQLEAETVFLIGRNLCYRQTSVTYHNKTAHSKTDWAFVKTVSILCCLALNVCRLLGHQPPCNFIAQEESL